MNPDTEVTIRVDGYEDAKRLALAVHAISRVAEQRDDDGLRKIATDAQDALQALSIETTNVIS